MPRPGHYPKTEPRLQKFCKKHKSIWGDGSWWCLYALWMDKYPDECEEEYLWVDEKQGR